MLKGISPLISPELLYAMALMGHGDRLVIADANFPAHSVGKSAMVIRQDGIAIPNLLSEVLKLFPLDHLTPPTHVMQVSQGDVQKGVKTEIWNTYKDILKNYNGSADLVELERQHFYEESKKAFAIVLTGETTAYANLMLTKGVL